MNNGGLARLKYYRGQMLTARDFQDQQEYHRLKQKLLLQRFPPGIIGGLIVNCEEKGADPSDFDGFRIGAGLAVDPRGNELVVSEPGIKVPVSDFKADTPYLSLVYVETDDVAGGDVCGGTLKNNRTVEKVEVRWDPAPNMDDPHPSGKVPPHITVAKIQLTDENNAGTICSEFRDPMNPQLEIGEPPVRINARVVDTDQLTDGAVTEPKIRNGAVTTDKLDDDAVVAEKIKNGAVIQDKLADNAVATVKIKDGAVNADKLDTDAVLTGKIKNGAVTDEKLAADAVITVKIKDENVTTAKLAPGAVDSTKLAANAVATINIQDGAVTTPKLAANAIATGNIQNAAVDSTKLAANAVATGNIQNSAVDSTKLAPNSVATGNIQNLAVDSSKLAANAVTAGKLAANAVATGNIQNAAVDSAKLAANAVGTGNIQNSAVDSTKLAANAVATTHIQNSAVDASKLAANAVATGNIQNSAVVEAKIANSAVTSGKLNLIITDPTARTVGPGQTTNVQLDNISQNALVSVIPVSNGELTWTYSVRRVATGNTLSYIIRVTNPDTSASAPVVQFTVRVIVFN